MKLIIFDIDGTLANTKLVDDNCFIAAFDKVFGIDIKEQNWSELQNVTDWGITEEIIKNELNRLPTQKEYNQMLEEQVRFLEIENEKDSSQFTEVEGAIAFFNHLNSLPEYKIGIATGAWEKSALIKLSAIGLNINGIAFSNSNRHKTREAITNDVISQLSINKNYAKEDIVYFGDGEWDFVTCNNLGIKFIGIDINNDGKLKNLGANNIFRNFIEKDDLLDIIELKTLD